MHELHNFCFIFPDEGVYNTYVLDIDVNGDKSWVLLLHCAEKSGTARYLSSFIMGRRSTLPVNVIAYLQDKLPRYDIDLQYLFQMQQNECTPKQTPLVFQIYKTTKTNKHPMKHPSHWKPSTKTNTTYIPNRIFIINFYNTYVYLYNNF